MNRIAMLTLVVCLLAASAAADINGSWTASTEDEKEGYIHLNTTRGRFNNMGMTMRLADFSGLTAAQIDSPAQVQVAFQLRREAGTASFEGVFKSGDGAGHFAFVPNHDYAGALSALGVELDLGNHRGKTDEEELFALAMHDVSTEFIKTMQAEGFRVSLEKYLTMRIFNVTQDYIREMRALGYRDISAEKLVETRIHRVTPDYIRKMRAAGWDLPLDRLIESRIHGATPEYAAEMKKLGYDLDFRDLVNFRIHRVTAEFIEEMAKLGYKDLDADDLVSMRIHRVTPEFIRELEAAGYKNVPVKKLVAMRIHGVDAKFIRKMNEF